MAKLKFGAMVTDMRGKSNGNVYSKNKAGAYLRTKVTPSNPRTSAQMGVRDRLASLAQGWRALTEANRAAWNGAVASFQRTNVFGDLHSPSGFNLFQRLNNNIIALGGTAIDVPPLPTSTDSYSGLALTAASGTPALSLVFTAAAGEDTGYKVFATAPQSAGKSNINSAYRLIAHGTITPVSPLNLLSAYVAKFGSVGAAGQKIGVKLVPCGAGTGIEGVGVSTTAIVAA